MVLETKDFCEGNLEIFCPEILVTQDGAEQPGVYKGPGRIYQTSDRVLRFQLHHLSNDGPIVNMFTPMLGDASSPGELLPPTDYYSIVARDLAGKTWRSSRFRIELFCGKGLVVAGDLSAISTSNKSIDQESSTMRLEIKTDVRIPINSYLKRTDQIGDKQPALSHGRGKFSGGEW